MRFFGSLVPAILISGALANPHAHLFNAKRDTCNADNCARAVTGTNATPALATRQADCSSFINAGATATAPSYASAMCSGAPRYSSACSCWGYTPAPTPTCLTPAQATSIVNTFVTLLTNPQGPNFAATANSLLASDFTDTSDSINIIAGIPLGATTFPSKQAFIQGQGSQAPIPSVTTQEIFNTCNRIIWRFILNGVGSGQDEVKGIDVFTVSNPASGQIDTIYSEFNSAAFLADIGNPECSSS